MSLFIIEEIPRNSRQAGTKAKFQWASTRGSPDELNSNRDNALRRASIRQDVEDDLPVQMEGQSTTDIGYYACPQGSWDITARIRTKRTDYPGTLVPSEQVLGAHYEPFTLTGVWDDRYNYDGYAQATWAAFDAMVKRGNLCKFSFENVVFHGIITGFSAQYKGRWRVSYSFEVSPHSRDSETVRIVQRGNQTQPVAELYNKVDGSIAALQQTNRDRDDSRFAGTVLADTDTAIEDIDTARSELSLRLDFSETFPVELSVAQWESISTQFATIQISCDLVLDATFDARADVSVTAPSVTAMLRFEGWHRGVRARARLTKYNAFLAARELRRRAKPKAAVLYRPKRGESIFAISNKFYGTPKSWHIIADRNRIAYYEFEGTEILVIPEVGQKV